MREIGNKILKYRSILTHPSPNSLNVNQNKFLDFNKKVIVVSNIKFFYLSSLYQIEFI